MRKRWLNHISYSNKEITQKYAWQAMEYYRVIVTFFVCFCFYRCQKYKKRHQYKARTQTNKQESERVTDQRKKNSNFLCDNVY